MIRIQDTDYDNLIQWSFAVYFCLQGGLFVTDYLLLCVLLMRVSVSEGLRCYDCFYSSLNSTTSSCKNPDSSAKTSDRCQACGKVRGTLGKASCTYNTDLK